MQENEVGAFEAKAEELIAYALELTRKNDAATELPQPPGSVHQLTQFAIMGFVAVTKMLIFTFRNEDKGI